MADGREDHPREATRAWLPGDQGLEFTAVDWLIDHHRADESVRRRIVADLHLQPGERVLDVGCGPGMWMPLFAQHVVPGGRVEGVDASTDLVRRASRTTAEGAHAALTGVAQGDFTALPFATDTFDVTFTANCLAYAPDRLRVLAEQRRVTRPGGRVVAKDYDGGVLVVHPLDPVLTASVVVAAARTLTSEGDPGFDNFIGRRLPALLRQAGLSEVATQSYAVQSAAPLSPAQRRTVRVNAEWYGDTAASFLGEDDLNRWRAAFEPGHPDCILAHPDLYFCMLDVVVVGLA